MAGKPIDLSSTFGTFHDAINAFETNLSLSINGVISTGGSNNKSGAKNKISSANNYYGDYDNKKGAGRISDEKLLNKLQSERFKYAKKYANEYKKVQDNLETIAKLKSKQNKVDKGILDIDKIDLSIKKQIDILSKNGLKTSQKKLEKLKEDKKKLQEINKENIKNYDNELKKQEKSTKRTILWDKTKNVIKEKSINAVNNAASGVLNFMKSTISSAFEQDSIMSKLAANYTLTKNESFALKKNILNSSIQTATWGLKTEDLVKMQSTYSDELGRSVMLGEDGMVSLAKMGIATGVGAEGAAQMASQMELFGLNAESSALSIEKLMISSKANGMSASVMTKRVGENLKLGNSYTFKNGVKGVQDMTIYSGKFRINMQSIATLADKISSPEGAIETAASLQVLGGSFAQMADPLKMLDQGINDMEGLTKSYKEMLTGVAKIDKITGEVTVGGYDRLRVKAAATAMGVSFDEMMESARTIAKRSAITADVNINPNIKGASDETKDMIASLSQFNKSEGGFQISVGGETKMLASLSKDDIEKLQPKDEAINMKTIAENTLGLTDILKNSFNQLLQSLMPTLIGYVKDLSDYIMPLIKSITGNLGTKGAQSKVDSKLKGAGIGAIAGGIFGGVAGGLIGGPAGIMVGAKLGAMGGAALGGAVSGNDVIIPSGGKPILLNSKDDVFAMKPGGAIANSVTPRNNSNSSLGMSDNRLSSVGDIGSTLFAKSSPSQVGVLSSNQDVTKVYGGVSKSNNTSSNNGNRTNNIGGNIAHNIQGSISLIGGNSTTKISASELVKDQQFVRELTRIIGNQMNRNANGGRYSGPLTNDSF